MLTFRIVQNSYGFFPAFSHPGAYDIQVFKAGSDFYEGQRSGTMNFTVFNPAPVITSITGTCRADLSCTPSNGFDVRINGNGFVANSPVGSVESSTYIRINGKPASHFLIGQGPVATQMQLWAHGSLIVAPGTYSLLACNDGTTAGTACSAGALTVVP